MNKILILCHEGNNRSVTLAHQLKYTYPDDDFLTGSINHLNPSTMYMLCTWADKVIVTDNDQARIMAGAFPNFASKYLLWDLGPDTYPRPFNKDLLKKVKHLIAQRGHEL